MPTPTNVLTHGTMTDFEPVDESGLLLSNVSFNFLRDRTEYKDSAGCVVVVKERNPRVEITISGPISSAAGFAISHPGEAVTTVANFGTSLHGFNSSDGFMVMGDVSRELAPAAQGTVSCKVTHYPFGTARA